jgi:hypothetical protein
MDEMTQVIAGALRQQRNPNIRARLLRALQAMALAHQRGGYVPRADNYPYGAHQEDQLNWHGSAGFTHGHPMGGYGTASDPYGLRYGNPGSLHPNHLHGLLSQGGGYGRPAQRHANPMKTARDYGGHSPLTHPAFGGGYNGW